MTALQFDTDAATLLWRDATVLLLRQRKSAEALVAIHRVVERRRPLDGDEGEYLALYRFLADLDPEVFTDLWSDPYAYYWTRVAYELLGAVIHSTRSGGISSRSLPRLAAAYCRDVGTSDPRRALVRHLGDFKRLLLGAYAIAGRDLEFDAPLAVDPPMAIPGTDFTLQGSQPFVILGLTDHALSVWCAGRSRRLSLAREAEHPERESNLHQDGPPSVETCPSVRLNGSHIRLQPALFNQAGLDFREMVTAAETDYQRRHEALLVSSLDAMNSHAPAVLDQFRKFIRVVAFKPSNPGTYRDNLSHSDFPGAIVAQPIQHPVYLAHVLVHEFHHNRLFCIEEQGGILDDSQDSSARMAVHYSPLRVDPRPMHGIVHGLYVFIPVGRYWLNVARDPAIDANTRALALDQLCTGQLQMEICAIQVARYARLSAFGRKLFQQMRADVETLGQEVRRLARSDSVPHLTCREDGSIVPFDPDRDSLNVSEAVLDHIEAYASADEASDILASLRI